MARQLFDELITELKGGRPSALATIIASKGSTPRKAGSQMLVRLDGTICGSVGGGIVEYKTILDAQDAITKKTSFLRSYHLSKGAAASIGMICGGTVEIYLQYFAVNEANIRLCGEILQGLSTEQTTFLVLDLTDETNWIMHLTFNQEEPSMDSNSKIYAFPLVEQGVVYVFGGGHVAQQLVPVLTHLDFRCTVIDDRAGFSNQELFPLAGQTLVIDLEHIGDAITIRPCDYVCIMTRGHQYDYYVQKQVLGYHPCYIGVMGSKAKIHEVTNRLLGDGFSIAEIEACHMPIGNDIKAETPAEIAISIAGELVAVRAARRSARKR